MRVREWRPSSAEILKLIRTYAEYQCLWNIKSHEYKNNELKNAAWEALANEFDKDVPEVKRKMKSLRSTYIIEKRKVEESRRTGEYCSPRWAFYKEFRFLNSVIVLRKERHLDDSSQNGVVEELEDITNVSEMEEKECDNKNMENVWLPQQSPQQSRSPSPCLPVLKKRRITSASRANNTTSTSNRNSTKANGSENIYSTFGQLVAMQLSQMSRIEATSTMNEVYGILSRNVMRSLISQNKTDNAEVTSYEDDILPDDLVNSP